MATEPGNFSERMFAEEKGRIGRLYFWLEVKELAIRETYTRES